ncbi:hypothetical protein [Dyella mobilis]|uniref:Uncharacterized protein n=1 Tax=Dyella mobilis TaxID=1849582 RepID=A0ABS2KKV2_9GAMM|nr:hypothetical protein [Dyella mobilis]MBM7131539.1 hypothetical protein [Dyella mobilis]GLQ96490.1 hypothetical protein GCM10007863_09080 [Dyella mobilis]
MNLGFSYERRQWLDDALYFRINYAAQPFCRVRDTGHEWEILFAPGKGPKDSGPYYAASFAQAKRWISGYAKHHEAALKGQRMKIGFSAPAPDEPWPWPT